MYLWLQSLNMIRILLFIISLTVFTGVSFSQTRKEVNKNWRILEKGSPEERIKSAGFLQEFYSGESIDSIKVVGEKLFYYALSKQNYLCLEESKIILCESMMFNQKYVDAILILKKLLPKAEKRRDNIQTSRICKLISQSYVYLKDRKLSLIWAKKSQVLLKNEKELSNRINGKVVLAESYFLNNKDEIAIKILKKLIIENKKLENDRRLESIYQLLGNHYLKENELKKSKYYFSEAFIISKKIKLILPLSHSINNLAIIDYEEGKYETAKLKFTKALDLRLKANNSKAISESYYNLGDFYFYLNDIENAKMWYLKSEKFCKNNNLYFEQIDALKALIQIAKLNHDYEEACYLFDEILKCQKTQSELQAKIDDDWAEINRQIILSEYEIDESNKKETKNSFIEWILISSLGIIVVLLSLKIKKINSIYQGKPSEN